MEETPPQQKLRQARTSEKMCFGQPTPQHTRTQIWARRMGLEAPWPGRREQRGKRRCSPSPVASWLSRTGWSDGHRIRLEEEAHWLRDMIRSPKISLPTHAVEEASIHDFASDRQPSRSAQDPELHGGAAHGPNASLEQPGLHAVPSSTAVLARGGCRTCTENVGEGVEGRRSSGQFSREDERRTRRLHLAAPVDFHDIFPARNPGMRCSSV